MGAGFLIIAALAAKKREEERVARSRKTKTSKENKSNEGYSYHSSDSHDDYYMRYFNYAVKSQIEGDEEITAFFTELNKAFEEQKELMKNTRLEGIQTIGEEYYALEQESLSILEEIRRQGIEVSEGNPTDRYSAVVSQHGPGYGGVGRMSYNYTDSLSKKFNGLDLTLDQLQGDKNPYAEPYEVWAKENPNLEEKLKAAREELAKIEKRIALFKDAKERKQSDITTCQEKITSIENEIAKGQSLQSKVEAFDNLTEEQKGLIVSYLKKIEECREKGDTLQTAIVKDSCIGYSFDPKVPAKKEANRTAVRAAIESMLASGKVTPEQIDKFMKKISGPLVTKEFDVSVQTGFADDVTRGIIGFGIYVESVLEERGITPLQLREQALEELEQLKEKEGEGKALL